MNTMTQEELNERIQLHAKWLKGSGYGERLQLSN